MTRPLIDRLNQIRKDNFSLATERNKKHVARYTAAYNKRRRVREFALKKGAKVQVTIVKNSNRKGGKMESKLKPLNSFYVIHKVLKKKKVCVLKNSKTCKILKKQYPFDHIRPWKINRK